MAALGVHYGHIDQRMMSLIIYAMAMTSVLSSYFIKGNHAAYLVFNRFLEKRGFPTGTQEGRDDEARDDYPIVILGFHRGAREFIGRLETENPDLLKKLLVIDFNLENLKELNNKNIKGIFGDIGSMDTLEHARIDAAQIIFSTIPDMLLRGTSNKALVTSCRALAPSAYIVATADSADQIDVLRKSGADEVLLPYVLIGEKLTRFVEQTCLTAESCKL